MSGHKKKDKLSTAIPETSFHSPEAETVKTIPPPLSAATQTDAKLPQFENTPVKRKLNSIIYYMCLVAFLTACVGFALNQNPNKAIFGYRFYSVLTESMKPEYNRNDVVIVKVEPADHIAVGDVITFVPPGEQENVYLTHRVENISHDKNGRRYFTTKGDANQDTDLFVTNDQNIIGKVMYSIPVIGLSFQFVQNNIILCVLSTILLFMSSVLVHWLLVQKKRKQDCKSIPLFQ